MWMERRCPGHYGPSELAKQSQTLYLKAQSDPPCRLAETRGPSTEAGRQPRDRAVMYTGSWRFSFPDVF